MNSSFIASDTYLWGATSAYTTFLPISEGLIPFGKTYQPSTSFIVPSLIVPIESTTTIGPTVLKPKPLPEDYDARVEEFLHFLDSFESETETVDDVTSE